MWDLDDLGLWFGANDGPEWYIRSNCGWPEVRHSEESRSPIGHKLSEREPPLVNSATPRPLPFVSCGKARFRDIGSVVRNRAVHRHNIANARCGHFTQRQSCSDRSFHQSITDLAHVKVALSTRESYWNDVTKLTVLDRSFGLGTFRSPRCQPIQYSQTTSQSKILLLCKGQTEIRVREK